MKKSAFLMAILAAAVLGVSPAVAQTGFTLLHSFAGGASDGAYPYGSLISDGSTLYGMNSYYGPGNYGTIFSVGTDGSGYTLLHSFAGGSSDGSKPRGSLISNGPTLYGMSRYGGVSNEGVVFSVQTGGTAFTLLHSFSTDAANGENPYGSLISDGSVLYGMTYYGGSSDYGTVFSIGDDGSAFTLLHGFAGGNDDGHSPYYAALLPIGSTLYGATRYGGPDWVGTVFSVATDGSGFTLLHTFADDVADNGQWPKYGLTADGSTLYGVTERGGPYRAGTVYSLGTDGSGFTLLHSFDYYDDGVGPQYEKLVSDGQRFYGTTTLGGRANWGAIFSLRTDGSDYTILHDFLGGDNDGKEPYAGVTLSGATLYGTTWKGGQNDYGIAFAIGTDGSGFTLLHGFTGGTDDGRDPRGELLINGSTLYGLAGSGGQNDRGVAFSMGVDGSGFTILHDFNIVVDDGANPYGGPILSGSTLYGMTIYGGSAGNLGTVYSLGTDGSGFTLLHRFAGGSDDGQRPYYNDLMLNGSTLYGMTPDGGTSNYGVAFSLGTDGSGYTILHKFQGGTGDGRDTFGDLTLDGSTLYGLTEYGGLNNGGVVFSLQTDGTAYTIRHDFSSSSGSVGRGTLLLEGSAFYGPTRSGGAGGDGTVFTIQPDGSG